MADLTILNGTWLHFLASNLDRLKHCWLVVNCAAHLFAHLACVLLKILFRNYSSKINTVAFASANL